jgi:hypothetical protein
MTHLDIVRGILDKVEYKDWRFELLPVSGCSLHEDLLIRVVFVAPDNVTGNLEVQKGRWWLIEQGTPTTQVVQAAWLAVQRAEMHEIAEQFRYKGATIFNRHIDVEALVAVSNQVQ